MCPLFKNCLVAPFLGRGPVIHNQRWTPKTSDVSEPLCRHYRNDVTHGQQELGTLTLVFYTKKALYVHTQLWHSSYDLTTTRSLKPILHMRSTIDLIKLFSYDSHYQVQNDFCFWKRRVLFLSVYFSSTSHTITWSCRKNRKTVQYSYKGFWVIRLQNRLLDGM